MNEAAAATKRRGKPAKNRDDAKSIALWKLMEGEPITVELLADVAGESRSEIYRRVDVVKASHPEIRKQLKEDSAQYVAKHYGHRSDPAIRDWLESIGIDPDTHQRFRRK